MDELSPAGRDALAAVRAARGPCPDAAALVEYESLAEAARPGHAAHPHIVSCSRCQVALLHMAEPTAIRGSALRWALPLAAVAVLAVALTLVTGPERAGAPGVAPPPVDTIRGTELQLTSPLGAVEIVRAFQWQSPIRAERYRVIVRRGGAVVWEAETTGLSVAPPAGVFVRDVEYEWQVEAIDREGVVRLTSPSQPFVVY